MRIADALARFLVQLDADGRSPITRKQYARHMRMLARWAEADGSGEVEDLSPERIARFLTAPEVVATAEGRPKMPTTLNALRSAVRLFCGYLHEAGILPANPARLVRLAITGDPLPRAIRPEEAEVLLGTMRSMRGRVARRDAMLFSLLLATGMRVSSVVRLDVADIDFADRSMRIWAKRDRQQVV